MEGTERTIGSRGSIGEDFSSSVGMTVVAASTASSTATFPLGGGGGGGVEDALRVALLPETWFIFAEPKGLLAAGGEMTLNRLLEGLSEPASDVVPSILIFQFAASFYSLIW